ncbi:MAG: prenyltransferase/squalene oxidase repeat-containing protein [Gaiellaceae bacterium]
MGIAALVAAAALAGPAQRAADYLMAHQQRGAFAEPGAQPSRSLSAWAALGLAAAGRRVSGAADYAAPLTRARDVTDLELGILGVAAAGGDASSALPRLRRFVQRSGAIGSTVNSTIWGIIALRQAVEPVAPRTVRWLLARQARSGGWSWSPSGAPDSNDTAAAIEALRAVGVSGAPIRRGVRYLLRLERRDGGFPLVPGSASDAQSTAWAVQAFRAARALAPDAALTYLFHLQRPDGSFRYSGRYTITPVFVTSQVLPALARRPFPLSVQGRAG